jgi:hypothetical protein
MPPIDLGRTARRSSSSRAQRAQTSRESLARVLRGRCSPEVIGGPARLGIGGGASGEDAQPGDVHAEEMARAMVSTTSRGVR